MLTLVRTVWLYTGYRMGKYFSVSTPHFQIYLAVQKDPDIPTKFPRLYGWAAIRTALFTALLRKRRNCRVMEGYVRVDAIDVQTLHDNIPLDSRRVVWIEVVPRNATPHATRGVLGAIRDTFPDGRDVYARIPWRVKLRPRQSV
jgi:hypothetical protein